jgi:hypothetical protein
MRRLVWLCLSLFVVLTQGCDAAQLLHASINRNIPRKDSIEVCVAEAGEGQRVWVLIHNGCVEAINWLTEDSMGHCSGD